VQEMQEIRKSNLNVDMGARKLLGSVTNNVHLSIKINHIYAWSDCRSIDFINDFRPRYVFLAA
jgi:hypothetical protein